MKSSKVTPIFEGIVSNGVGTLEKGTNCYAIGYGVVVTEAGECTTGNFTFTAPSTGVYLRGTLLNLVKFVAEFTYNMDFVTKDEVVTGGGTGVSPTVDVSEIEGGHRVTITDINGEKTFNVMDGADGEPGEDGKTPEKGVDYFTEADKAELVGSVLASFTNVSEVGA